MRRSRSFRFLDDDLNHALIGLLKEAGFEHSIDSDGRIHYAPEDDDVVGNELICSVRDGVFPSWQVLTCPPDWTACYKDYMRRHGVPFREEWSDGEPWFLLPRKYRPHSWKLDGPVMKDRRARRRATQGSGGARKSPAARRETAEAL